MRRYADIEACLFKRGYYPKGGGEVKIIINGKFNSASQAPSILLLEQKKLLQIRGVSHASADLEGARVAERQSESVKLYLGKLNAPFSFTHHYYNSLSTGSGITLWAVFGDDEIDLKNPVVIGADGLGEKNKKAEDVGKEAADNLLKEIGSGAAVDKHLADQLIPFMALAGGIIRVSEVTKHVKSNIYVAEKFLDVKFDVKDNVISCEKNLD
jgi:RNA 3'-terminal phosphate cyclase